MSYVLVTKAESDFLEERLAERGYIWSGRNEEWFDLYSGLYFTSDYSDCTLEIYRVSRTADLNFISFVEAVQEIYLIPLQDNPVEEIPLVYGVMDEDGDYGKIHFTCKDIVLIEGEFGLTYKMFDDFVEQVESYRNAYLL